jgi:signal peptidase II
LSLRRRRLIAVAAIAAIVIAVDQVTKTIAIDRLSSGPVHVVGPFSFALEFNTGVAFSIGSGAGALIVVAVIVLVAILGLAAFGAPTRAGATAIGLVLGGALSNLGDRLFRGRGGAVVDFVHTSFWPTFNVADAAITIGCVLLAIVLLRQNTHHSRVSHDADAPRSEVS